MNFIQDINLYNDDLTLNAVIEICPGTNNKDELTYPDFSSINTVRKVVGIYPFYYGSFPQTQAGDDDPLDFILITDKKHKQLDVIKVETIGAFHTVDCGQQDDKIVCVESGVRTKKLKKRLKEAFSFLLKYKGRNPCMLIQKKMVSKFDADEIVKESNMAYKFILDKNSRN